MVKEEREKVAVVFLRRGKRGKGEGEEGDWRKRRRKEEDKLFFFLTSLASRVLPTPDKRNPIPDLQVVGVHTNKEQIEKIPRVL